MTVRAARPGDALAICAIWNEIIRDTLATFTTEEKAPDAIAVDIAKRGGRFLVTEQGGRISGFATYGPFRPGPGYRYCCEHSIQLAPEARGRGIGRALMTRLGEAAATDGLRVMVAGISGAAPGSLAFHAALGFEETGRLPGVGFKHGQWLDLVFMQKRLGVGADSTAEKG